MGEYPVGADELSVEIVKKAFVWYYRAWSYYWQERPRSCVIHPAESFVEMDDEVVCLRPRGVAEADIRRLQNAFAQPLTFIAPELPAEQKGYSLEQRQCVGATPWLERFLAQVVAEYADLRDASSDGRQRERRRQEWRFAEAGQYDKYFDGRTTRVNMQPEAGEPYTYTLIENRPILHREQERPQRGCGRAGRLPPPLSRRRQAELSESGLLPGARLSHLVATGESGPGVQGLPSQTASYRQHLVLSPRWPYSSDSSTA